MSKNTNLEKNLTSIELGYQAKGFVAFLSKDPSLNKVIRDFRYSYTRASSFFKKEISKIKITLVYSREEMNSLIGYKTASWSVGFAGFSNEIFILSPSVFDEESNHNNRDFRKVLTHEISHLFIRQIHNSYEPVWLEEGLAYCVAGQKSRFRNNSLIFNNPEAIFLIDTSRRWNKTISSQPDVPYALAFLFVDFLIKRYNKNRVIKLLMSLGTRYNKKSFCQKFRKVYGKDMKLILKEFFPIRNIQKGGEKYAFGTCEGTFSSIDTVSNKDARRVPQFVSILNVKELGSQVEADKNCISPNPPLPPPCVGRPPPPCYGCYGG